MQSMPPAPDRFTPGIQQQLLRVESWAVTNDDWYTPPEVFDALGLTFDLDVAAPPGGIPWIPARRYFTPAEDGLAQEWEGLVWCNPPFSGAKQWARRFRSHGNGVLLASIPNNSEWFPGLIRDGALIWFGDRGWEYHRPDGKRTQNPWPTFLAAMGVEAEEGLRRLASIYPGALVASVNRGGRPRA